MRPLQNTKTKRIPRAAQTDGCHRSSLQESKTRHLQLFNRTSGGVTEEGVRTAGRCGASWGQTQLRDHWQRLQCNSATLKQEACQEIRRGHLKNLKLLMYSSSEFQVAEELKKCFFFIQERSVQCKSK